MSETLIACRRHAEARGVLQPKWKAAGKDAPKTAMADTPRILTRCVGVGKCLFAISLGVKSDLPIIC
jgi:hypothetical protein